MRALASPSDGRYDPEVAALGTWPDASLGLAAGTGDASPLATRCGRHAARAPAHYPGKLQRLA